MNTRSPIPTTEIRNASIGSGYPTPTPSMRTVLPPQSAPASPSPVPSLHSQAPFRTHPALRYHARPQMGSVDPSVEYPGRRHNTTAVPSSHSTRHPSTSPSAWSSAPPREARTDKGASRDGREGETSVGRHWMPRLTSSDVVEHRSASREVPLEAMTTPHSPYPSALPQHGVPYIQNLSSVGGERHLQTFGNLNTAQSGLPPCQRTDQISPLSTGDVHSQISSSTVESFAVPAPSGTRRDALFSPEEVAHYYSTSRPDGPTGMISPGSYQTLSLSDNIVLPYTYPAYRLAHLADYLRLGVKVVQWNQAIRAALVLTAMVEDLRHLRDGRRPSQDHQLQPRTFSRHGWIRLWVSFQPTKRRATPDFHENMSPHDCMLYPRNTSADDWNPFWISTREVVFDLLSGLKDCFPHTPSVEGCMDDTQWLRWVIDVLWTLHQLIRIVNMEEDGVMASVRRGQSLQEQQAPVQAMGRPQSQVYSRVFQFAPSDPPLHSPSQASRSEDPPQASRAQLQTQRIQTDPQQLRSLVDIGGEERRPSKRARTASNIAWESHRLPATAKY